MQQLPVIAIDGSRLTVSQRTGTENYTRELLRAIALLVPPDPIRVYLNADHAAGNPIPGEVKPIPFPRLWTHLRLSLAMLRSRPGVLFVPAHVVPLVHPSTVVTIHDVGYLHEPDSYPAAMRGQLRWSTAWSLRAAHTIITPSVATRDDLVELGTPIDQIVVIPHGLNQHFLEDVPDESSMPENQRPYILAVGTIQPRKNLSMLLRAFAGVVAAGLPHNLVVAGNRGWKSDEFDRALTSSKIRDRIEVRGFTDDQELRSLYRSASLFCMPSLAEGFGLPALEAMASGVPVIVSNRGSLPEIVDEAGIVLDANDVESWTQTMHDCLTNQNMARRLSESGLSRAAQFTWETSAKETLAVLRDVRDGKRNN